MAGWDLKVGEIKQTYVTDEDIWKALNQFYSHGYTTMSYKYGFLKSLIENLYSVNENLELNFTDIFYSFTKIYWNLVIHHKLWQSHSKNQPSSIQKSLEDFCLKHSIPREWTFDKLSDSKQIEILEIIKKNGKKYVIGAFYSDTNSFFYEFDLKREYLKFNVPVYRFFQKHQRTITYLTNYHLAKFLESNNTVPNINYILGKVEVSSKRDSLAKYLEILSMYDKQNCFYCGKSIKKEKRSTHVDHFIPWSFIQNDNLWNLVIACQKCNTQKSDKIAEDKFLNHLLVRNQELSKQVCDEASNLFTNYKEDKLIELYQYSIYNGFSAIWSPSY
ncbi:HNH endonuclease [Neobacillus bataviensis]|uniref:HNH endonuclease n=1 Tax=Neobacillus bataviensis TaxID=220685 RepID=A0A561CLT5_9BACI|nr:HNH endonuclease domain-containing protein [Neobacillus bataviensis]TWD92189.1 HNH endonuclease [Neobacillus bataviensis]